VEFPVKYFPFITSKFFWTQLNFTRLPNRKLYPTRKQLQLLNSPLSRCSILLLNVIFFSIQLVILFLCREPYLQVWSSFHIVCLLRLYNPFFYFQYLVSIMAISLVLLSWFDLYVGQRDTVTRKKKLTTPFRWWTRENRWIDDDNNSIIFGCGFHQSIVTPKNYSNGSTFGLDEKIHKVEGKGNKEWFFLKIIHQKKRIKTTNNACFTVFF